MILCARCVSNSFAKKGLSNSCLSYNLFLSTGSREGRESPDKRWTRSCKNIVYSIWSARSSFRYAMQTTNITVPFVTFGVLLSLHWPLPNILHTKKNTGTVCFASGKPAQKWSFWGRSYWSPWPVALPFSSSFCPCKAVYVAYLIFDEFVLLLFAGCMHHPFISYTCIAVWI